VPGLDDIRKAIRRLIGATGPYEQIVKEYIRDLQRALISSDVNVRVVFQLTKRIREKALKEEPPPGVSKKDWLIKITYDELVSLFGGDKVPNVKPSKKPYVIMLVGVQGSGKTTTAGKLAYYYISQGYRVGLVAADTYRPGAYDQLKQLAERTKALFYGDPKSKDPIEIAKRGVKELVEKGADIVIVDTAGRHGYGEEEALLREMREIAEAINPDEVMLVIDASMGQKAYDLAKRFHEATPIGSIIVTKMDGTAKGGGALSAVVATGATIKFVGVGEDITEFEVFNPKRFVSRILGLGDIESLIERVERLASLDMEGLQKATQELLEGRINFRIIYRQLMSIRKLGPFKKILQMIPGFGIFVDSIDSVAKVGEKKIEKWLAAINSMTYEELDNPSIIDKSRMKRIAIGAGVDIQDVKELINYYKSLDKMLKQLRKRKDMLEKLVAKYEKLLPGIQIPGLSKK